MLGSRVLKIQNAIIKLQNENPKIKNLGIRAPQRKVLDFEMQNQIAK